MKKGVFVFYEKASTFIAAPILFFVLLIYLSRATTQPGPEVYSFALTAFGITAALSSICFRMASVLPEDSLPRYAGEKFLHSAILLIQTLFLTYVKETFTTLDWFIAHQTIRTTFIVLTVVIISILSVSATICWDRGFSSLNSELWQNWRRRIEPLNNTEEKSILEKSAKTKNSDAR